MLHDKIKYKIDEIQSFFRDREKSIDALIELVSFFDIMKVSRVVNAIKTKGYYFHQLLSVLIILPYLGQASIYAFFKSGYSDLSEPEKDAYYRLKNDYRFNWRELLKEVVRQFVKIIARHRAVSQRIKCFIVDDSVLEKTGKCIEGIGRIWDHVTHRYVLGFKMLVLGYYDGSSFVPVDFSLHREEGKNKKQPYGLTKGELSRQYTKSRPEESPGTLRIEESDQSKIEMAAEMIKKASRYLVAEYVLMDSWFTCEKLIRVVRSLNHGATHLIGMMKMAKAKYQYQDKEYTAQQLLSKKKVKIMRCRKIKSQYKVLEVRYKEIPLKLFFSKFGKQDQWHLIVTSDQTLTYKKAMEIYQTRWTIEVFFKESKQYLNMGRCQSNDFDAQIADITIGMIQYIMLTVKKRFGDYESKGTLFRELEEKVIEYTLAQRLWGLFLEVIVDLMAEFNIDLIEFMKALISSKKANAFVIAYMNIDIASD